MQQRHRPARGRRNCGPATALIYLACTQREDGGFYQNFWINGEPFWRGTQLDETAFPVMLAWRLHQAKALQDFDPYPMVLKAAGYLIHNGPATPQERWEENSGYSPSTLAAHIAALICAAAFARERGQAATAQYLEEYADFLESHIEPWTVTTEGSLVPGISRHFIRIHPVDVNDPRPDENANRGTLELRNQPPGAPPGTRPKILSMPGFWSCCGTAFVRPGSPSSRIRSASWTPSSRWTPLPAPAGGVTTTTAMDSGKMVLLTRVGGKGTPGRC